MTIESEIQAVEVHIKSSAVPLGGTSKPKKIVSTMRLFNFPGSTTGQFDLLLPNSPKRVRAVVTTSGNNNQSIYLCSSESNAQQLQGCLMGPAQVIDLLTTSEVWIATPAAGICNIGLIAEYESDE